MTQSTQERFCLVLLASLVLVMISMLPPPLRQGVSTVLGIGGSLALAFGAFTWGGLLILTGFCGAFGPSLLASLNLL